MWDRIESYLNSYIRFPNVSPEAATIHKSKKSKNSQTAKTEYWLTYLSRDSNPGSTPQPFSGVIRHMLEGYLLSWFM